MSNFGAHIEPHDSMPDIHANEEYSSVQHAIRARALQTIENQQNEPKPSLQRRLSIGLLVLLTVILLIMTIDFSVRIMHRILSLWEQDEAVQIQAKPKINTDFTQPFYISVEPESNQSTGASAGSQTSSSR